MREFETGATRDSEDGKLDYEGFLSPSVLQRYAEYMHQNRIQADGNLRASDNWQKGIPRDAYMKSMWRHFMDVWDLHRNGVECPPDQDELQTALCALLFNVMGYLHEEIEAEGRSYGRQAIPQADPNIGGGTVTFYPPHGAFAACNVANCYLCNQAQGKGVRA